MWVDHFNRTLFVAIPKAASKSTATAFLPHGERIGGSHADAAFLQSYLREVPAASHYFKFTFVRNPWDRLLSAFCFFAQTKGQLGRRDLVDYELFYGQHQTFPKFVTAIQGNPELLRLRHLKPQIEYLSVSRLSYLDYVGRFERLEQDIDHLNGKLGMSVVLPHLNRTSRGSYRDYYSPETRDIVARIYQADIETLGYNY